MAKSFGLLFAGAILMLGAASCSGAPDERIGSSHQALTTCYSDADCASTGSITTGEHCGFDHACHTAAADPSCGLWTGTYPNCDYHPGSCRTSFCVYPATCEPSGNCELPGGGYNNCAPYAYADPCVYECEDESDCDPAYTCESSPVGNVCG